MITFKQFILENWEGNIKHSSNKDGFQYLRAYNEKGQEVGSLEYKHHPKQNELSVWMIKTHPDYRRKGIATAIMDAAKKRHPDSKIDWGTKTFDGLKFVRKYGNTSD